MKSNNELKKSLFSTFAILAVSLALVTSPGCGSGDDEELPPVEGGAEVAPPEPSPSASPSPLVCLATEEIVDGQCISKQVLFERRCGADGGAMAMHGAIQVCRIERSALNSSGELLLDKDTDMPRLTKTKPAGAKAYKTGLQLQAGARLFYTGYGYWGTPSFQWVTFNGSETELFSSGCVQFTNLGYSNGTQYTFDGLPAGLLGSDGGTAFFLDPEIPTTIGANAELLIGVNAPDEYDFCGYTKITRLKTIRCYDIVNTNYACD